MQTPKSKHVRKGESAIRVHVVQLLYRKNLHSFKAYLYSECATSKTEHEPQGGEIANAELDVKYK